MTSTRVVERLLPPLHDFLCGTSLTSSGAGGLAALPPSHSEQRYPCDRGSSYITPRLETHFLQESYARWRHCFCVWRRVLGSDILLLALILHSGCVAAPDYALLRAHRCVLCDGGDGSSSSSSEPRESLSLLSSMNSRRPSPLTRGEEGAAVAALRYSVWALNALHFLNIIEVYEVEASETTKKRKKDTKRFEVNSGHNRRAHRETVIGEEEGEGNLSAADSSTSATFSFSDHSSESSSGASDVSSSASSSDMVPQGLPGDSQDADLTQKLSSSFVATRGSGRGRGRGRGRAPKLPRVEEEEEQKQRHSHLHPSRGVSGAPRAKSFFSSSSSTKFRISWDLSPRPPRKGKQNAKTGRRGRSGHRKCGVIPDAPASAAAGGVKKASEGMKNEEEEEGKSHALPLGAHSAADAFQMASVTVTNEDEPLVQRVATLLVDEWLALFTLPSLNEGRSSETACKEELLALRSYWMSSAFKLAAYTDGTHSALLEENVHIQSLLARQNITAQSASELLHCSIPSILNCLVMEEVWCVPSSSSRPSVAHGGKLSCGTPLDSFFYDQTHSHKEAVQVRPLVLPPPVMMLPLHLLGKHSRVAVWVPTRSARASGSTSKSHHSNATPSSVVSGNHHRHHSHVATAGTGATAQTLLVKGEFMACEIISDGFHYTRTLAHLQGTPAPVDSNSSGGGVRRNAGGFAPPKERLTGGDGGTSAGLATQSAPAWRMSLGVRLLDEAEGSALSGLSSVTAVDELMPRLGMSGDGSAATRLWQPIHSAMPGYLRVDVATPRVLLALPIPARDAKRADDQQSDQHQRSGNQSNGSVKKRGALSAKERALRKRSLQQSALATVASSSSFISSYSLSMLDGVTLTVLSGSQSLYHSYNHGILGRPQQQQCPALKWLGAVCSVRTPGGGRQATSRATMARDAIACVAQYVAHTARRVLAVRTSLRLPRADTMLSLGGHVPLHSIAGGEGMVARGAKGRCSPSEHDNNSKAGSPSVHQQHAGIGKGKHRAFTSTQQQQHGEEVNDSSATGDEIRTDNTTTTTEKAEAALAEMQLEAVAEAAASLTLLSLLLSHNIRLPLVEQPQVALWLVEQTSLVTDVALATSAPVPRLLIACGYALCLLPHRPQSQLIAVGLLGELGARQLHGLFAEPANTKAATPTHAMKQGHRRVQSAALSSSRGKPHNDGSQDDVHLWWGIFQNLVLRDEYIPGQLHTGVWQLVQSVEKSIAAAVAILLRRSAPPRFRATQQQLLPCTSTAATTNGSVREMKKLGGFAAGVRLGGRARRDGRGICLSPAGKSLRRGGVNVVADGSLPSSQKLSESKSEVAGVALKQSAMEDKHVQDLGFGEGEQQNRMEPEAEMLYGDAVVVGECPSVMVLGRGAVMLLPRGAWTWCSDQSRYPFSSSAAAASATSSQFLSLSDDRSEEAASDQAPVLGDRWTATERQRALRASMAALWLRLETTSWQS